MKKSKKRVFHISKEGRHWIGREESKENFIESGNKQELTERMRDKARLNRPSEIIFHETNGEVCKESFEDKKLSSNAPLDFLTD